jgi:low molecular weight phosphotyrosine protein phosphatase
MDKDNLRDLQHTHRKTGGKSKVMLFGEYSGKSKEEVQDPYYGARNGFEIAYEQCMRFSRNFLQEAFPDIKP